MSKLRNTQPIMAHCHLGCINYSPSLSYQDLREVVTATYFTYGCFTEGEGCDLSPGLSTLKGSPCSLQLELPLQPFQSQNSREKNNYHPPKWEDTVEFSESPFPK